MNCGVGCRHGSDLELPWLWHRLAAAALIRPLAWEPPYATGVALPKKKKKKSHKPFSKDRGILVNRGQEGGGRWKEALPQEAPSLLLPVNDTKQTGPP